MKISSIQKTEVITNDIGNQYKSPNNKEDNPVKNSDVIEESEILSVKPEENAGSSIQEEDVSYEESLKRYGIEESDIIRLQNGEISLEDLMKEIDKDPEKKKALLESQSLLNSIANLEANGYTISQKVYNLDELDNYIKKLESEIAGYINDLHNKEELNALAGIIESLENGVDLDSALESRTVGYMYKDAKGEKHYVYDQPIGTITNDPLNAGKFYITGADGRTYESQNYKEMYGESEYIKELRNNLIKENSNFFEKTFLNQKDEVYKYDKNSEQSIYIESLKETILNNQKESNELEGKIYNLTNEIGICKSISTNVKEEVDYYMKNINPYVMQDDYLSNINFNNDSTKIIDDLKEKYNLPSSMSQPNSGSVPKIYISDQKEKVDIVSCIINGKGDISGSFIMSGNTVYELDSGADEIISHYAKWSKLMSDKEVEIFNYIYNTDTSANKEKAYQYLKDISSELDKRWLQSKTSEDQDFASDHHTLASLGSVVVTPFEGMSAFCYSLKEYINEKTHPEDETNQIYRTDVYSSGNIWRSQVARDIAETNGNLASFIYSTGMSMADSVSLIGLSAATGGGSVVLSAGLMGSRAYVSTLNDSLDRGLTDGQAIVLAASSAVVETAMEHASLGHLMHLEENLGTGVIEIVNDIANGISDPEVANVATKCFYILANSVCQGLAEGEEEVATEILNYVSDIFVSKDSSQFLETIQYYLDNGYTEEEAVVATLNNFSGQLTQAFVGGFASGFCFGGFSGVKSTINTSYGISKQLYTDLQGDTKAQQFASALKLNQQQLSELEKASKKKEQDLTESEIELLQKGTTEQQAGQALIKSIGEAKKIVTKEESSSSEKIVGTPISGLKSNIIENNNTVALSKQEIESFIDEYLKDPTITIPKGVSNELVEYLEKYLHNPDTTCPMGIPNEIIEYINSKSFPQATESYNNEDTTTILDEKLKKIEIMQKNSMDNFDKINIANEISQIIISTPNFEEQMKIIKKYKKFLYSSNITSIIDSITDSNQKVRALEICKDSLSSSEIAPIIYYSITDSNQKVKALEKCKDSLSSSEIASIIYYSITDSNQKVRALEICKDNLRSSDIYSIIYYLTDSSLKLRALEKCKDSLSSFDIYSIIYYLTDSNQKVRALEICKDSLISSQIPPIIDSMTDFNQKVRAIEICSDKLSSSDISKIIKSHSKPEEALDLFNKFNNELNLMDKIAIRLLLTKGTSKEIIEAIEDDMTNIYVNKKDINELRTKARQTIEYLKHVGFTDIEAANVVGDLLDKMLSKVGYDSYYDPQTGIIINVIKNIDWRRQAYTPEKVIEQIKTLPSEMQAMINKIYIYDTFNPYDFCWEIEYDMNDFVSWATGGQGQIDFWCPPYVAFDYSTHVIPHEIAHTYDMVYASIWGVETDRISESGLWLDAMAKDLQISGKNGVTEYARSSDSSVEDFAESIALYYTNPNALDEFPARKAVLEQYLPK